MSADIASRPSAAPSATPDAGQPSTGRRVALVTGMSGAGRTTVLRALEDAGYEAVDNLPMSLLPALLRPDDSPGRPLAIGVDTRTRGFAVDSLLDAVAKARAEPDFDMRLMFIDCDDEVLRRRFTETRRRHPLAMDRPVTDGIRVERALLRDLRDRADLVIDTSTLSQADLKRRVQDSVGPHERAGLAVQVISFAYRNGLPRDADLVFDVRFLANPHYVAELRPFTGRDAAVAEFIERDPGCRGFLDGLTSMLVALLPRYEREGKSYLTIAIGCTGGKHRSVYVAERLAAWLQARGQRCGLVHRDMALERHVEDPGMEAAQAAARPGTDRSGP